MLTFMSGRLLFGVIILGVASGIRADAQNDSPSSGLASVTLPIGTQLPVSIPGNLPMCVGTPVHALLLYPVYAENGLVLPADTVVNGSVESLQPNHKRRVTARLRFDFTPFHTPVVGFTSIVLPSGATLPIVTGTATDGAPVYRLVAPPPRKGGFVHQQLDALVDAGKERLKVITGQDKGDRLLQLVYSQLPYHPERIAKGTAWTVETAEPVTLAATQPLPPVAQADESTGREERPTWILQAYLDTALSSATSKAGQPIQATVAEPVLNPDGSVAVPQGSVLTGSVSAAHPARRLSRAGQLRFAFRTLTRPGEQAQSVNATLTGVDSAKGAELALNSEGEVKAKPQDKLVVPLILIALAARPLDQDGGRHHDQLGKDAVASNALGAIGFIIGTAAGQPNIAAGIGYYGAALSIYERIFARGKEVAFARDTRIVIQTQANRNPTLKTTAQP